MAKKDKQDPKLKKTEKPKMASAAKVTKKTDVAKKKSPTKKSPAKKKTAKKIVKVKKKVAKKKLAKLTVAAEEIPAAASEAAVELELPFDADAGEISEPQLETKPKATKAKKKAGGGSKQEAGTSGREKKPAPASEPQGTADEGVVGDATTASTTPEGAAAPGPEIAGGREGRRERRRPRARGSRRGSGDPDTRDSGDSGDKGDKGDRSSKETGADPEAEGGKGDRADQTQAEPAPKPQPAPEPAPEPEPDPGPPPPERVDLAEFQQRTVASLYELGTELNLRVGGLSSKHDLIFEILTHWGRKGTKIDAEGILEITNDGYGFLRWPAFNFMPHADDVYISSNFIRDHSLQTGNLVRVVARSPREREKFISVDSVTHVEGTPVENWHRPIAFDGLTALSPRERLVLEDPERRSVSPRAVDIIAPLGKGQRGVIVAPPRGGKTILLKEIAGAISRNHPETEVIVLLLDERPEEVTDFEESDVANVYSSTFDEPPERHVQVAELVAERAKRLVEIGKDVVILMDSLTRLARGYNGLTKGQGKTMSGGIDAGALQKSRRLFNIARNTEEGGSLTLIATALIDTGARMDDVIFEEFKGSGNMELELDRELLERRIFPAINIQKSGTRKDDLLYHPDEFKRIGMIRRQLAQLPGGEAMEKLIHNIENTKSNAELLLAGLK